MTPEELREFEEVFHEVRELSGQQRAEVFEQKFQGRLEILEKLQNFLKLYPLEGEQNSD